MEPLLAEAYEAVLRVEQLAGVSLLNRASLQGDVAAGNGAAADDLAEFNRQAAELHRLLPSISLPDLKERLIFLRIQAMNVENEFGRLAEAIQQVFVQAAGHDG
ncbi:hypothetical protein [Lysobacter sp. A3-1-A15]